ncbi:MAG: DUF1285 domain-containing protein, partial [Alphaproteobacteria bacterium]|nr:DUF1285 domain-containing protein [Alphaproteobacteria bacterium]
MNFSQVDLAELARKHEDNGLPAQDFDMRIDDMGTWFHQGGEIKRQALVKLFASVLTRLDDGSYWLITPAERGRIEVADAPFYAPLIEFEGEGNDGRITIITSLEDRVVLGADHTIRVEYDDGGAPRPYVNIRGGLDALLARSVYYDLAERA